MPKTLSQDEIDILLQVQTDGEDTSSDYDLESLDTIFASSNGSDKKIVNYNFKRPRLFSHDQIRLLNHVHEAFARDLSVYLSAQLRTIVDISVTAIDQVLYSEFVMSSAPPSALFVLGLDGKDHQMVMEMDTRFVMFTIEKLFGGSGEFQRRPREISQIEQRIMSKVINRAFRELERAWKQLHEIKLREEAFESNAEFVQIIPGVEPALVVTLAVTVYEQRSFLNICYPYILLETMLGRSSVKQWFAHHVTEVDPEERERYEQRIQKTQVQIQAMLGHTKVPVRDLAALEVGDVIPLARRIDEPIEVMVGGKRKYLATAGRSGKHRALKIEHMVDPDPDDFYGD
ncbi:MAG: flagellar motor switch protein FliM [Rhodothermales bacterium]